jgi:hypothetical protein
VCLCLVVSGGGGLYRAAGGVAVTVDIYTHPAIIAVLGVVIVFLLVKTLLEVIPL